MAITFLKKAKDFMPVKNMRFLLHHHLHGRDPHRGSKTIHASALTKEDPTGVFCAREFCLSDVTTGVYADGWISTSEQLTFALGHAIQDQVIAWFADMGRAVGHWRCHGCNQLHQFQPRPVKCTGCFAKKFYPEEVRFVSSTTGASCGIDMMFNNGGAKLRVAEIKTMAPEEFKKLSAPLSEHRVRTQLYLRIIEESAGTWRNRIDTSEAEILYVSKGGYGVADPELKLWGLTESFSPFKHYVVKRDHKNVEPFALQAQVVKEFREGKVAMPHGICATGLDKRAQNCSFVKACFSGQFKAGMFKP